MGTPNSTFNTTPQPVGKTTGIYSPNKQTSNIDSSGTALIPQPTSMVAPGSTVGLLPNHTLKSDAAGNTYNAPKSNPSVLAQQQALNKLGAGLVEDGIAGPKTEAAIAKYGTGNTTSSTSTQNADGSYQSQGGATINADGTIKTPAPTSPTPQVGSTTENAQGLLNTGSQTPLENQTYTGLLNSANEANDPNGRIAQAYQKAQDLTDQYATQEKAIQGTPIPLEFQQGRGQIVANQYGTQEQAAQQGISNALTGQGQKISGLNAANSAAQTTAARGTQTAGSVLSASLNTPTTPGQATFNSLTGYQGGTTSAGGADINQFGDPNDPKTKANYDAYMNYYNQYNAGLGGINQAAAIEPTILSTISSNPQLNNQPISAITDLNQFLSGQTSQPGQQQLSTQVAAYIKNLGIDPATLQSNIASQQSGTLIQLLSNLKNIAIKNNNALKTTADSLKTGTSGSATGGGFTEGQKSSDGSLVYKNGKWVKA